MRDLWRLVRMMGRHRGWMALGVGLSLIVILANVALLALSGWFITSMALAGMGLVTLEFFTAAAAIRGLAVLRTIARYLERLVTHEATLRFLSSLRVWFYTRLEPLAPARLQGVRNGDLLSRMRADIDSLDNFYLRIFVPFTAGGLAAFVIVGGLAWIDGPVALLTSGALIFSGIVVPVIALWAGVNRGQHVVTLRAALQGSVTDLCRGLGELRVSGAVGRQAERVLSQSSALIRQQRRAAWAQACAGALSGFAGQAAMWGALALLLPRVAEGSLSAPDLTMMVLAVMASAEAVSALPGAFAVLGETMAAARRIFVLSDMSPAVPEPAASVRPQQSDITFDGVFMHYDPAGEDVLRGVSFHVPQGQAAAITGPSGSGKTTIFNALQRFYPYRKGHIRIGGVELGQIGDEDLRAVMMVVGQHAHVFSGTIRDNLLIAAPEASDDDLWRALDEASLSADVREMRKGLDTLVGEMGTRLSGGQARRLIVARAFLRDAPIILLDEPTEGLDARNEALVVAALQRLMRGRTTLVISHRPGVVAGLPVAVRLGSHGI